MTLLLGRGLEVDAETRQRLSSCRDTDRLKSWLLAATRVDAARDMFD